MLEKERIQKLRECMKEQGIQIYLVPTADYHGSEYVGAHFEARKFLTGFTGSAGTAVVTQEGAWLWTDGRYFLQAAQELEGTEILLQKSGEEGVPTIQTFLKQALPSGGVIGFDGRTVGMEQGRKFAEIAESKGGWVAYEQDLIDRFWEERPALSDAPAFSLDLSYAGETVESKLKRVRRVMEEHQADAFLITALDEIGWLLNIRGADVAYCPLLLSYAVIQKEKVELYTDVRKLSEEIQNTLEKERVIVYPYEGIYERMRQFSAGESLLLDPGQVNYTLFRNIPSTVRIVERESPILRMKAIKNPVEVDNLRKAHLKDGIAHTKFLYWLKEQAFKEEMEMTELCVSARLEEFRRMQPHFLGPSFAPICAYKEHAAIVHYSCDEETNVELKPEGLLLMDTGGHYMEGSTDITRTVALGRLTEEEGRHFTTAVCAMLCLADAKFPYGCTGENLDYAARAPFWRQGLNYNHGTGHGVGYLGNIHEGPARISWRTAPGGEAPCPLEVHMVLTDEPGIYIENSHGIRIENELLVCADEKNAYGQFLRFEVLTCVPIDLDALEPALMTEEEKSLLNVYHQRVYETIGPYLTKEEQKWLRKYTRAI